MIRLFCCGDILNSKGVDNFIGPQLLDIINGCDFVIGNLEGVERSNNNASGLTQGKGTLSYLKSVGFNLLLLANNHITDAGYDSFLHTKETIGQLGMYHVGANTSWDDAYAPLIVTVKNKKIAILNYCEAQVGHYAKKNQKFGYAWIGGVDILKVIDGVKRKVDYVIVCVHMGLEHYDIPIPEVRALYKEMCDAGASCIIGGHTHTAQGFEYYKNSIIVYSLGNFFFPVNIKWPDEAKSYSVVLELEDDRINITTVHHINTGAQTNLLQGAVNNDVLNTKLGNDYYKLYDNVLNQAYNSLCHRLLIESTCGQDSKDSFKTVIRKAFHYLFLRKKYVIDNMEYREKTLLRLFENETYRYIITRYLKNLYYQ